MCFVSWRFRTTTEAGALNENSLLLCLWGGGGGGSKASRESMNLSVNCKFA